MHLSATSTRHPVGELSSVADGGQSRRRLEWNNESAASVAKGVSIERLL
jgi:hypothetical protein